MVGLLLFFGYSWAQIAFWRSCRVFLSLGILGLYSASVPFHVRFGQWGWRFYICSPFRVGVLNLALMNGGTVEYKIYLSTYRGFDFKLVLLVADVREDQVGNSVSAGMLW